MRVLLRHIEEVPADRWPEKLALERRTDEAEAARGYPLPRRYRSFVTSEHSDTVRVEARIFESYTDLGRRLEERARDPELLALDAGRRALVKWEREELFYVDSGGAVPRWMEAVARNKDMAGLKEAAPVPRQEPAPPERVEENIRSGKVRVLYRQIQEVPRDRWLEKLEQERLSDAVESAAGNPTPMRYRAMFGSEKSQIRVGEREYESLAALFAVYEPFFEENDPENRAVMDAEVRRQEFFNWEREELYYVDSDSFTPRWMDYAAEQNG